MIPTYPFLVVAEFFPIIPLSKESRSLIRRVTGVPVRDRLASRWAVFINLHNFLKLRWIARGQSELKELLSRLALRLNLSYPGHLGSRCWCPWSLDESTATVCQLSIWLVNRESLTEVLYRQRLSLEGELRALEPTLLHVRLLHLVPLFRVRCVSTLSVYWGICYLVAY